MKVLGLEVNWMDGCGNDPFLNVVVDKLWKDEDGEWERRQTPGGGWLYRRVKEDFVSFLHHKDPMVDGRGGTQDGGYGGFHFNLTVDGVPHVLMGPWSSSESTHNMIYPDHHCMTASIGERGDMWRGRQSYGLGGHVKVEAVVRWVRENPDSGVGVVVCTRWGGRYYVPTRDGVMKNELPNPEVVV